MRLASYRVKQQVVRHHFGAERDQVFETADQIKTLAR